MKAWQFTNTNEPLVLSEIAEPSPGPGEVVLEIKAAGLCHSDVGAMTDPSWLSVIPVRPIVIGHEVAGVVCALGEGVANVRIGERCGVWPMGLAGAPGYARMEDSPTCIEWPSPISSPCQLGSALSWRRWGPMPA